MRARSADGKTRFEHAKEQIEQQSSAFDAQGYDMGLFVFSHRYGSCADIELRVPMMSSISGAKDAIDRAIAPLRPLGGTPLALTIKQAADYIKQNHFDGTEVIVVSDGGDNCGGDAVAAAQDLRAQTGSTISIVGMDIQGNELSTMQAVAHAGGGTFRSENTGTGAWGANSSPLIQPNTRPAMPLPGLFSPSFNVPGMYTRPRFPPLNPQPSPSPSPQGHGREGAPDDSTPIIDPNSVPREMSFDPPPPETPAPKVPLAAPEAPPSPPAPKPMQSNAPPELPATKPFLM